MHETDTDMNGSGAARPSAAPAEPAEGVDTSIYGMPSFSTLQVRDLDIAVRWYTEGLGMHLLATMGNREDGTTALVHLRRWRYQDLLLVPAADLVEYGSGLTLSMAANLRELDELAAQARRIGLGQVLGPEQTAWGTTDLRTTDPDGHTVIFTAPPASRPQADDLPGFTMDFEAGASPDR
ncbi:VOC family protein [Streptomyces lasalocidi]|uniref:VOC family protein n=1 Tax=Streptomyces lasalocidi TaxID=324833 RepID=A0A4U5W3Y0_STRLS|nr:VOC family protein [Streptomyces lasalocidi]TKS96124.1 VOC family protein [Streptomyces lasalocidi]